MPVSLHDMARCFNQANMGLTAGDGSQAACAQHLQESVYALMIGAPTNAVLVYTLKASRQCDWRYRQDQPEGM